MSNPPKSTVLLPLYIYPHLGAWDPLYRAISSNTDLDFIIIINPNSGPGAAPWWPNADYVREIPKLNGYSNVRTVGYVRTNWCKRPVQEVLDDVDTYASWSSNSQTLECSVRGMFFDETPSSYNVEVKDYLTSITEHVKQSKGILGDQLVIHNPGTMADFRLMKSGPDIIVVTEVAYTTYRSPQFQELLSNSPNERFQTARIIHSTPTEKIQRLVSEIREGAQYLFVTGVETSVYQSFGLSWDVFIQSMR